MTTRYRVGDRVVFTRNKYTTCPGRRAKNIVASTNGESYQYQVDKYWIVIDVRPAELTVATRRGKTHSIQSNHPQLRKATFFERLFKNRLFPQGRSIVAAASGSNQNGSLNTLGPAS